MNVFEWFKRGIPKFDKGKIILASQDEGLLTNWLKKIFKLTRQLQMQVLPCISRNGQSLTVRLSKTTGWRKVHQNNNACWVIHACAVRKACARILQGLYNFLYVAGFYKVPYFYPCEFPFTLSFFKLLMYTPCRFSQPPCSVLFVSRCDFVELFFPVRQLRLFRFGCPRRLWSLFFNPFIAFWVCETS